MIFSKLQNRYSFAYKFFLALICLLFVFQICIPSRAFANFSNTDKLYGETLSQREMKISDCPAISAKYACLMSSDGTLIYDRDAYKHAKIASMTKIMTAIVTLENADLSETLTINEDAVEIGESSAGF